MRKKTAASSTSYDAYLVTGNVSNDNVRIVGCAPEGFSSVVSIKLLCF